MVFALVQIVYLPGPYPFVQLGFTREIGPLVCLVFVGPWYVHKDFVHLTSMELRPSIKSICPVLCLCSPPWGGGGGQVLVCDPPRF